MELTERRLQGINLRFGRAIFAISSIHFASKVLPFWVTVRLLFVAERNWDLICPKKRALMPRDLAILMQGCPRLLVGIRHAS
jgi:hypothetical protein